MEKLVSIKQFLSSLSREQGRIYFNIVVECCRVRITFFVEGALDGRGWPICGERFMICKDSNYKFYIVTLIWVTIYVETENCCITCYFPLIFFSFFRFIKSFFNSVNIFFILLIAYLRGKVYRGQYKCEFKLYKIAIFLSVLS